MKNVLVIVLFLSGFAFSGLQAQACKPVDFAPCPPGCCIINCCLPSSTGASASSTDLSSIAMFASLPVEFKEACKSQKMSKKEMKACTAACTKYAAALKADANYQVTTACGSQAASHKIVHKASADIKH